jgi:hypothetical protein
VFFFFAGEKYMGMWVEDYRHGPGIMVTLDGMYFEGAFNIDKLSVSVRQFGVSNRRLERDSFCWIRVAMMAWLSLCVISPMVGADVKTLIVISW